MCDLVTVGSSAAEDSLRPLCGRLVCQASIYYILCIKASIGLQRDSAAAKPIGGFIRVVQNSYSRDKQNNDSKSGDL